MNNVMLAAMLGGWEVLVIFLVVLFWVVLVGGGIVLLVVWLVRRERSKTPVNPPVEPWQPKPKRDKPFKVHASWLVLAFISVVTIVGFLIHRQQQSPVDTLTQKEFLDALQAHQVIKATVIYGRFNIVRVTGTYNKLDQAGTLAKFRFKTENFPLREKSKEALLSLDNLTVIAPNNSDKRVLAVLPFAIFLLILLSVVAGAGWLIVWLVRRKHNPPSSTPPVQPQPEQPKPDPSTCPRCGTPLPADSPQGLCPRCVMGVGLATQTEATSEFAPHGTKIVPPPQSDVARRFPHLEILDCLGHGGMGVVYKARQPKLNRIVALKILAPEKGADPKFAERFLREAQALARLNHPNIVTVHDFGEADGMFYLLMEYVDGATLRQLLREERMKPETALTIVPRICEALQFAHDQGVVHRDIKPENVLLDKQGRVKIADFGIAKIVGGRDALPRVQADQQVGPTDPSGKSTGLTQDQVLGTPNYMAPEQVEKPQLVDHRADIYSLGVVFYEMLTGELPLGKFQPPSKKVQVDVRLDEVVLHALEKEPERRYQHASEVKSDVETIATTPSPGSSPARRDEAAPPESQSRLTSAATTSRRFSRTAIVGASLITLAAPAALLLFMAGHEGGTGQTPTTLGLVLGFVLVPLAIASAFGTTILGWISVSQIRHSAGKLYGLGLAVFDGLLFPLLALDGFILLFLGKGLVSFAQDWINQQGLHESAWHTLVRLLLVLLIYGGIAIADYWIIRRVWRAATRPMRGLPASASGLLGTTPVVDQSRSGWGWVAGTVTLHAIVLVASVAFFVLLVPQFRQLFGNFGSKLPAITLVTLQFGRFVQDGGYLLVPVILAVDLAISLLLLKFAGRKLVGVWGSIFFLAIVIPVGASIAALFLPLSSIYTWQHEGKPPQTIADAKSKVAAVQNRKVSFSPVVERSLLFNTNGMTDSFDLESNQIVKFPRRSRPPGCFNFVDDAEDKAIFIRSAWKDFFMPVESREWETLTAARKMDLTVIKTNLTWTWVAMVQKSDLPVTCLFRTSTGRVGVFQLSGLINGEDGVGLRYKFVTENSTNVVLLPPEDFTQQKRPNGMKPIPREAVKQFTAAQTLSLAIFALSRSNTKHSMVELAKLEIQRKDSEDKLAALIKDTPVEGVRWDETMLSQKMNQLDPNKDGKKWQQAQIEMNAARFQEEKLMAEAGAAELIQPQAKELRFGPWIKATLLHPSAGSNCCISFDSGTVLTPPPEILKAMTVTNRPGRNFFEAMQESFFWGKYREESKETNAVAHWIEGSSVDAIPLGAYGLVVFCPVRISMLMAETGDARDWESQITPAWLLWKLYFTEKSRNIGQRSPSRWEALPFPNGSGNSTNNLCLFRTRAGSLGILQITGFTENPPGVKIRYKLVERQPKVLKRQPSVIARTVMAVGSLKRTHLDGTHWEIDAMVHEADIAPVEPGQNVTFTLEAFAARTFRGKVVAVADAPTVVQDVNRYTTTIRVTDADPKFKPGMTATVSILVSSDSARNSPDQRSFGPVIKRTLNLDDWLWIIDLDTGRLVSALKEKHSKGGIGSSKMALMSKGTSGRTILGCFVLT
jgi:tRNA A-37 threonylcarbamoyl transferase component Bud32